MAKEEDSGEADKWVPSKKSETSGECFTLDKLRQLVKQRNVQIGFFIFVLVVVVIVIIALVTGGKDKDDIQSIRQDNSTQRIGNLSDHKIIYRDQWNGKVPKNFTKLKIPVPLVVVEEVGQTDCYSQEACSSLVRTIQSNSIAENAPDVYHNFILGGDGNIYVGRGWEATPQGGDNMVSIAIIGNFNFEKVSNITSDAAQHLLKYGVDRSLLTDKYKLVCHNQTVVNGNCGSNLYSEIKKWKHYDPGQYFELRLLPLEYPKRCLKQLRYNFFTIKE